MKKLILNSFILNIEFSSRLSLFNRRKIPLLFFLFFFSFSFFVNNLTAIAVPTSVRISLPLDRIVYQQNNSSVASFVLAGQVQGYYSGQNTVEYQIERLNKDGIVISTYLNWTSLALSATGFYKQDINTLPTGWYKISVRYLSSNTVSVKVGVGEVIVAAGQSNAQGIDLDNRGTTIPGSATVNYDCLIAVNETCWCYQFENYPFPKFDKMVYSDKDKLSRVAPNGNQTLWCYQELGKLIVDRSSVVTPVMFFNAGAGGTGIDNWKKSAENLAIKTNNSQNGYINCETGRFDWGLDAKPEGQPYLGLKNTLNFYAKMLGTRGIIWH